MDDYRVIDGFPKYRIGRDGRVINSRGHEKTPYLHPESGYFGMNLYSNGRGYPKRVHRLVAETFIPNPENKPEVNHKDGNKQNNSVDNLEWVTRSENMLHAYSTGLNKPHPTYGMLGKHNPNGGRKGKPVRIVETGEEKENRFV